MTIVKSLSRSDMHQQGAESFEALFNRHYTSIYGVLFRLMGDRAEAEDLAQETFLRLYHTLQSPRQKVDNVGGWLYRVATRLGYNALRAARRRSGYEQVAAGPDEVGFTAMPAEPSEEVAQAEQRRLVRAVLAELSHQQVQLLTLRYAGLSYKELAETLEVSPTSIGSLLARAERAFEARYKARSED